jgi:hypothetical protein
MSPVDQRSAKGAQPALLPGTLSARIRDPWLGGRDPSRADGVVRGDNNTSKAFDRKPGRATIVSARRALRRRVPGNIEVLRRLGNTGAIRYRTRAVEKLTGFIGGLKPAEPVVAPARKWRFGSCAAGNPADQHQAGAAGSKRNS